MNPHHPPPNGRGAAHNPVNRFTGVAHHQPDDFDSPPPDEDDCGSADPRTQFIDDASVTVITRHSSPDIPFEASLNPYRGCEHGCSYCYARPYHEYLGYSAGLDFETKIIVKRNAAALLRAELAKSTYQPTALVISGVTDPYQPVERRLGITRSCLEVLCDCRHPVGIITKNRLVTRDADLLGELARHNAARVNFSITTLDPGLARDLEPRAATPAQRIAAIRTLSEAGVPVRVMVAPVIPGLNDHEIPAILSAARDAGARFATYITLRLPHAVESIFIDWLERNRPGHAAKVLSRLREMRGGSLNDSRFGSRMTGEGTLADMLQQVFDKSARRLGYEPESPPLSAAAFRPPVAGSPTLFG